MIAQISTTEERCTMKQSIPYKAVLFTLRLMKLALMLSFFASFTIFLQQSRVPTELEKIQESGQIRILSRNGPTTYYEGPHGLTGFEYTLSLAFAKHLGVELVIEEEENLRSMLDSVGTIKGNFAAAGLTITDKRKKQVLFTDSYLDVTQQLIYKSGTSKPRSVEDLYGKSIIIIGNSSHSENLRKLKREYPQLEWEERYDVEMVDLLDMVNSGEIDHTIVDSNAYDLNRSLTPNARVAFNISEPEQLAWAFPLNKDDTLYKEAQKFFTKIKTEGLLDETIETVYGHLNELDYGDAVTFANRLDVRLPKWEDLLRSAAEEHDLDWHLLAAISYQESHWNPKAISPTGVRGFMMLTRSTAKYMGVKNRTNAEQSIRGGAKYFKSIYNRLPDRISNTDRTWFALASYNIGLGHVNDARILTEHFGGNPDKWADVRENINLLSKRKYYKSTKHGYARGWEAINYVRNIRNFYNIIAWQQKEKLQQVAHATPTKYEKFSPVVMNAVISVSTATSAL